MLIFGATYWVPDIALTSFQILLISGGLLLFAAMLYVLQRKKTVMLERSLLTDELIAYLARISDALERRPASGDGMVAPGPSTEQIVTEVVRRLEEISQAKLSAKVRPIPSTGYGREFHPDK
jgi:hypothetical protein